MPLELELVPAGTVVEANGEASPVEISASTTRTFLCTLEIFQTIEQQSLDLSIWGSADGQDFGRMPLLKFPQRFYRGVTRLLLDRIAIAPERVAEFQAEWRPDLLGGVMAIRGAGALTSAQGWEDALYRSAPPATEDFPLTAVPYYAWDNRSPGGMRVWLRTAGR